MISDDLYAIIDAIWFLVSASCDWMHCQIVDGAWFTIDSGYNCPVLPPYNGVFE